MTNPSQAKTSYTLISKIRHGEEDAWAEFVARYGALIYRWCTASGIRDPEDVAQEVLSKIFSNGLGNYRPSKGPFRPFLRTIVNNCLRTASSKTARGQGTGDPEFEKWMETACDDFENALQCEIRHEILGLAMEYIEPSFNEQTWQAFRCRVYEGRPAADVAAQLGMSVHAVFKAVARVKEKLEKEILKIDPDFSENL